MNDKEKTQYLKKKESLSEDIKIVEEDIQQKKQTDHVERMKKIL